MNHPSDLNWIFFALIVLITAICLALFNSGLKLGKKSNTKWLGYIEFPLFIAAVVLLIYHAILIGTDFEKNITQNEIVTIESPNKHLYISGFTNNNAFSRDYDDNMFNDFVQIKNGNIINKNVKIRIKQGTKDKVEVEFTRRAHAETDWEAINRAENIKYNYQINNDTLILANTFTIPKEDKMRGQEFRIDVYLPIDYAVQFDKEVHKFSYRIPFKENLYIAHNINTSNYTWNLNGKLVKADLSTQ